MKAKRPKDLPFIRKGEVGDWRNYFTEEESKRIDEMLIARGSASGLAKLWESYSEVNKKSSLKSGL